MDLDVAVACSRNRALDEEQVLLAVDLHDLEAALGDAMVAHVAGEAHVREHAGRVGRLADRAGRAVEHGAVGRATTAEAVAAAKVAFIEYAGSVFRIPMQFGPRIRMPPSRAMRASRCASAAGSRPSISLAASS